MKGYWTDWRDHDGSCCPLAPGTWTEVALAYPDGMPGHPRAEGPCDPAMPGWRWTPAGRTKVRRLGGGQYLVVGRITRYRTLRYCMADRLMQEARMVARNVVHAERLASRRDGHS